MKQNDNETIDTSMSCKPTYIKVQNNHNCQQFFGEIHDCVFMMPAQADNNSPKKQTAVRKAGKKPQPARPMTLKYYRHGNNGVLNQQRQRIYILYRKWTEWKWIDKDTTPEDFDALFEGEPRHCNITWTANTTVLTILLHKLLIQDYIDKQTGCSAKSLVNEQFGKTPNFDQNRIDSTNKERIDLSLYILDISTPLPSKGRTSDDYDVSDAALNEVYEGRLRVTKGI